jgi:chromosome partitioning protein
VDGSAGHVRAPAETEWLIMDAPAKAHGEELENMVRRAQTLIMPVVPSPVDLRAAVRFLDEIRHLRQVIKINVKLATIANRVREGGILTGELEDYLFEQRLPNGRKFPFLTSLRAHSNYLRAAARGLSIFEFAPFTTLYDREQWAPLLRWLKSEKSVPE